MSTHQAMTCEACRDAITDLVCDELDETERAEVLAHAASCEACSLELSRFRAVLGAAAEIPLEAPSPRLRAAVMDAARQALTQGGSKEAPARRAEVGSLLSRLRALIERLSVWAMSPQVAMASVLILMVGIGLYALPLGDAPEQTALRAAEVDDEASWEEGAAEERAATATAAPVASGEAEPEQLEARTSDGKLTTSPESARRQARREDSKAERAAAEPAAKPAPAPLPSKRSASRPASNAIGGGSQKSASGAGLADDIHAPTETSERLRKGASPYAKAPPPAAAEEADFAPAPARAEGSPPSAEAPAQAPHTPSALSEGVRAAQAGDHKRAIALLSPLADAKEASANARAEARRWLAHAYRGSNDCKTALRYYEPLVAQRTADRTLLLEAADCFARVGNQTRASELERRARPAANSTAD